MSEVEDRCQEITQMLGDLPPETATAVLTGVLALHMSRAFGDEAAVRFDMEFAPVIKALVDYHQRKKLNPTLQ